MFRMPFIKIRPEGHLFIVIFMVIAIILSTVAQWLGFIGVILVGPLAVRSNSRRNLRFSFGRVRRDCGRRIRWARPFSRASRQSLGDETHSTPS